MMLCLKFIKSKKFCPLLVYSLKPYFLTLINNGKFSWVKKDQPVIVHCPYPKGIAVGINYQNQKCTVRLMKNEGSCPLGYNAKSDFSSLINKLRSDNVK